MKISVSRVKDHLGLISYLEDIGAKYQVSGDFQIIEVNLLNYPVSGKIFSYLESGYVGECIEDETVLYWNNKKRYIIQKKESVEKEVKLNIDLLNKFIKSDLINFKQELFCYGYGGWVPWAEKGIFLKPEYIETLLVIERFFIKDKPNFGYILHRLYDESLNIFKASSEFNR